MCLLLASELKLKANNVKCRYFSVSTSASLSTLTYLVVCLIHSAYSIAGF